MKKLKFVYEKCKKIIVPTLAATMITTAIGCSPNKSYMQSEKQYDVQSVNLDKPIDGKEDLSDENNNSDNNGKNGLTAEKVVINSVDDINNALKYDTIEYLKIENADIKDFSFLKNINVKMLQILNNQYPIDMDNVRENEIEQMYFHNTEIKNKEEVLNFKNLQTYIMKSDENNKNIQDLSFLKNSTKLTNIEIQNYAINNLEFAHNLKELKCLSVNNSAIETLSGIENCSSLRQISIQRGKIKDINALKTLKKLESIDLSDNNIKDVNSINSPSLLYLNLSDNFIQDVKPLSKNSNLGVIDLSKNNITELPVELLDDNISIDISYNNISKITEQGKNALKNNNVYINIFDNLLDSSTIREISKYDTVYFETNGVELTTEQSIKYSEKVKNILSTMGNNKDENIIRVSKYIMDNCKLDYTYVDENKDNAYGALFSKAVCTGTTDLTNTLCRHQNIQAKTYHGDFKSKNDKIRHVWSICNGYHVDAMQSMANKDSRNYPKLVLLSDEQIKEYGYILDANNMQRCEVGKTEVERTNIVNDIENSKQQDIEER